MEGLQGYSAEYSYDYAPANSYSGMPVRVKEQTQQVPAYTKTAEKIAGLTLDAAEERRDVLPEAIKQAFAALPTVNENDTYLGGQLKTETDLSAWEMLPNQGHDRSAVMAAGMQTLHGQIRWHSPAVMHNITPAPLLDTVAASAVVNTYNPNMLWDFVSGGGQATERQILRQMGRMIGWDEKQPEGAFTFGGKGCLINAVRAGLNRCVENMASQGLPAGQKPVVISSAANHDCIATVCSLLGLGKNAWLKVPLLADGTISMDDYRATIRDVMEKGIPIACIIASGGDTLNVAADSPVQMRKIMEEEAAKVKLNYKPFLYFDTVVSWAWMTFKDYDWDTNSLDIGDNIAPKMKELGRRLGEASACDAIGIDFHKTGLVAYQSSLFVIRNAAEYHSIYKDEEEELPRQPHGNNFIQHHTLEHSRSFAPVLSAWIALQNLGVDGLRSYLAHLTEIGAVFQEVLPKYDMEYINPYGLGFASVFWPKSKNGPESYQDLLAADEAVVEQCNDHTFTLFNELANPSDGDTSIVLRYVPQFQLSECGLPAGTLIVYPMAVATSKEQAYQLAHQIGRKACKMQDMNSTESSAGYVGYGAPMHVPK